MKKILVFLKPDQIQVKKGNQPIVGASVATFQASETLVRHLRNAQVQFFTASHSEKALSEALLTQLQSLPREDPWVLPGYQMPQYVQDHSILAFHDPTGSPVRVLAQREILGDGHIPLTFVHHTISYASLCLSIFVPVLLYGRPYDACIVPTTSAKRLMQNLLDHASEALKEHFGKKLKPKLRLEKIPLGIDVGQFKPKPKSEMRTKWDLPIHGKILLSFGRVSIESKSDQSILLHTFKDLLASSSEKDLHLVVAGNPVGKSMDILKSIAVSIGVKERCIFIEDFPSDFRQELYSACDIFLAPTDNIQETFGITPLEAMASGVPQVVADWDGYRDTVQEGETGFRIKTSWAPCCEHLRALPLIEGWELEHFGVAQSVVIDRKELFQRTKLLIEDNALRKRMGERSLEYVKRFDWPKVIHQYETLWKDLSKRASGLRPRKKKRLKLFTSDHFKSFSHYASETVDQDQVFQLTDLGQQIVQGKAKLPAYPPPFNTVIEVPILSDLFGAMLAEEKFTYRAMLTELEGQHIPSKILSHLQWLWKHGIISPLGQ